MTWWQAMILGVVEGLTEYLPVSSTGHLIVVERMLGIPKGPPTDSYAIFIQAGAIVAVLGLYMHRVRSMGMGLLGRDPQGMRLAQNVGIAFLPAAVVGALANALIEEHLFGLWPIVAAWVVGGVAILAVSWRRKQRHEPGLGLDQLHWRAALLIGLVQCVAMWPGTSRSLVTIVAGVVVGLSLAAAVEFSFLLGVLTLGAATIYTAFNRGGEMVEAFGITSIVVGFVTSTASAVVAVKWMVSYLNKNGLTIFGYYRIAVGLLVALLIWAQWIEHQ